MTEAETDQAVDALKQWFNSQDIMPGDAAICMVQLLAEQLVAKSRDFKYLQDSVDEFRLLLMVEIAGVLRR